MKNITLKGSASSKRKYPDIPEDRKFVAKFVTVACKDERDFKLLT